MSQPIRICVVSDAPAIDWGLFSWMKPLAEQGISFTVLAQQLPKLPWFEKRQVTAVSAETIKQLANLPQLNGRSWDIFYFTSVAAALTFTQQRVLNGRFIIRATNWDLTVAPHLSEGKKFTEQMGKMLALAHRIEVATDALRETAVAFAVNPQKIVVIPPGVNLNYYEPLTNTISIAPDAPVCLLAIMPLEWFSGLEYLLQTIRCCLDAGLAITADVIGYGSERQRLYYLLDDFQLFDVVQPINHLPRPALRDKLQQAHILLQTNLTDDVNLQTLEGMACGLPSIAFAGSNWQELLGELSNLLLAPLRQPQKMADLVCHLAQNPSTYGRLRQQTRQLAAEKFGLSRQVAQFDALFTAVMQEAAVGSKQFLVSSSLPPKVSKPQKSMQRFWQRLKLGLGAKTDVPQMAPDIGQPDSHLPKLAVATIAVGEAYARWALTLIESVRGNGRFFGPVYVVTDCADLFAKQENVHALSVPQSEDALVAKQYKTWLTEWITFEQTLFLDADVVVGRPLLDWYTAVSAKASSYPLLMFPDEGFFDERYHTGVILMQRALAAPLMARWRAAIQSGQHSRDQSAFMAIAKPEAVYLMPDHHLIFPTIETFKRGHSSTFNHITFTGRQRNFNAEIIHNYLQKNLQLAQLPMS